MAEGGIHAFRPPSQLDITTGNISESYKKWHRQLEVYLAASGATEKDKKVQTAIILHCAGPQVLEIYDQFTWDGEGETFTDKDDPEHLFGKLKQYCNPRENEVLESHRFWNLQYQEPFDKFLTELKTRAASCNFLEQDRMMRDKIVFTMTGKIQEVLLRQDALTLEKAVKLCRAFEQANQHVKELREVPQSVKVNKVEHKPEQKKKVYKKKGSPHTPETNKKDKIDCKFCGYMHEPSKYKCFAWGKTCEKCKGRNHFQAKCKKIHAVSHEEEQEDSWLLAVSGGGKDLTAMMEVNDCQVKFQLDSAADVNTICKKFVRQEQTKPTKVRLNMWNKTKLQPIGEAKLEITNPSTGQVSEHLFIVVPNGLTCLLGLTTIQKMGLVTVNSHKFIAKVETQEMGDLGEASLKVDPEKPPKILPCRKVPLAIQSAVKDELDRLVEKGVLIPVTEPTRWVSQMAVAHKKNGQLRICIDPQPLNAALMREHYRLPVLDDVLPKLHNAKLFSKLDIKEAYWNVRLDDDSSKLTTMITPCGRYRWARLPFGLKVSSEIFQRKLDEAIGDLEGVFSIVDDIVIAGCGDTEVLAKQDHQKKLQKVFQRCADMNIVLNEDKQEIGLKEINFHGHRITKDGVMVDEKKVKAIREMPAPTDVSGVKRLCGMVQYMARFLPDLSGMLEPIRELTRKDQPWIWSEECEDTFKKLKEKLSQTPVLAYFDPKKEVVVQVDSSKDGIGAVLLQDGRPVEYASRALTKSERKWAQIEKEALSVLYGLERFDQYTYGRPVKIQNDHKPLATILQKPLAMAPRRLQDIMMRFHRYDVEFEYVKGVNLLIADTLSRAFLETIEGNFDERIRILSVQGYGDVPDKRLQEVRDAMSTDTDMKSLVNLVLEGWPEAKHNLPAATSQYYDFRETLSYDDGILLKGEAIVIPKSLRSDMKNRLHSAHLGYNSMMRRARGTIFWPGMAKDIQQMADCCETCQARKPRNQQEPIRQPDDGSVPWQKVGADLFEIQGKHYLVVVDYYSNFIEVDLLTTTTSARVIALMKKQFARFGIPKMLVSDGGPQFSSQEFKEFMRKWGVTHTTSSPMHQQANGKAEAAVKIMKTMMTKTAIDGTDPYEALLEQRNTPRQDTGLSPTHMMFGRVTRAMIPSMESNKNIASNSETVRKRKTRQKQVQKSREKRSKNLSELKTGQDVYFQHQEGEIWKLGQLCEIMGPHSYLVKSQDGAVYRRNRLHIRPTMIQARIRDQSPYRYDHRDVPTHNSEPEPIIPMRDAQSPNTASLPNSRTVESEAMTESQQEEPVMSRRPSRIRKQPAYLKDYVQ